MAKYLSRLVVLLLLSLGVGAVYYASTKETATTPAGGRRGGAVGPNAGNMPTPVSGTEARLADMPIYLDGVGTVRPLNSVTVRSQVDGRLIKVHFKEGQTVAKDELLAEIDATTFQAQLDQVLAKKALTETQLANARRDAERYARIPGVVAQKTVDTQNAQVAQLEAQLKADEATVASARAVLSYTRITAPLSGRTGLRLVDEGNFIRSGGDTGLVVITQVQPIAVLFTMPQQQLQRINRALAAGALKVEAVDADGKTVLDTGVLQVVDNQVDQTTGTVRLKAEFANARVQLWPGQFVNVRLLVETLRQVVVVPTPAIQRGPNGPFAYVVGGEDRVAIRPVEVALQTEADSIIKSGIAAGDRVVTAGFARLQDNARVIFGQPGGEAPASPAPAGASAPGAAGGGGGGFARVREACGAELATVCAGVERDGMRACVAENKAKFSPPCQAAIDAAAAGGAGKGSGDGRGKRGGAPGSGAPSSGSAQAAPAEPKTTPRAP